MSKSQPALRTMTFAMLDTAVDMIMEGTKEALIPYLMEVKARLSAQGRRSDLKDTPDMTWGEWKESKRVKLGLAPRTLDLLLTTGSTTYPKPKPKPFAPECKKSDPAAIEADFNERAEDAEQFRHDTQKPTKLDADGRYRKLSSFVGNLYGGLDPAERQAEIYMHADRLKEDF